MILMWHHPKYYKELAKKRKQLEREQASERASEHGGWVGPRAASRGASKQAIKRPGSEQASSVEYDPNHSLRGKVFRGGLLIDLGARSSYTALYI